MATADLSLLEKRPDLELAVDVQHAIDVDRAIPGGVHAAAANGEVTLTGRVHSLFQKAEAAEAARGVRGVRAVHNLVEVGPEKVESPDDCC